MELGNYPRKESIKVGPLKSHFCGISLSGPVAKALCPKAGGPDSIPGQGARFHIMQLKIPYAARKIKVRACNCDLVQPNNK